MCMEGFGGSFYQHKSYDHHIVFAVAGKTFTGFGVHMRASPLRLTSLAPTYFSLDISVPRAHLFLHLLFFCYFSTLLAFYISYFSMSSTFLWFRLSYDPTFLWVLLFYGFYFSYDFYSPFSLLNFSFYFPFLLLVRLSHTLLLRRFVAGLFFLFFISA